MNKHVQYVRFHHTLDVLRGVPVSFTYWYIITHSLRNPPNLARVHLKVKIWSDKESYLEKNQHIIQKRKKAI